MGRVMTAVGLLGAVALIVLRVWLAPAQRDIETGLFASNTPVIILSLLLLGVLVANVFVSRGGVRHEIAGKPAMVLAVVSVAVGAALALTGVADFFSDVRALAVAVPGTKMELATLLVWLQHLFCLLAGAALVRLGLVLVSEGVTRRGMAQWSMLAPVLWLWLVLANYEMSYASMVRLSDGFFTLMAYVMEMLFLFYFARYMAGVGKVGSVLLLLFSCGTTLFAVSAPVVKLLMYLLQDSEAYAAAGATGMLDLAVGVLALTVSVTLCQSMSAPLAVEPEEEEAVEWPSEQEAEVSLVEPLEDEE